MQEVRKVGALSVPTAAVGSEAPVFDELVDTPFAFGEASLRVALAVTEDRRVVSVQFCVNHLALDGGSLPLMLNCFETALERVPDCHLRENRDQVALENQPDKMNAGRLALARREVELQRFPEEPPAATGYRPPLRSVRQATLSSNSTAAVAHSAAQEHSVWPSAVLLAAVHEVLTGITRRRGVGYSVFSSNRHRPLEQQLLGCAVQDFPVYLPAPVTGPALTARHVQQLLMRGSRSAQYPVEPSSTEALAPRPYPRGTCAFNMVTVSDPVAPEDRASQPNEAVTEDTIVRDAAPRSEDFDVFFMITLTRTDMTVTARTSRDSVDPVDLLVRLRRVIRASIRSTPGAPGTA